MKSFVSRLTPTEISRIFSVSDGVPLPFSFVADEYGLLKKLQRLEFELLRDYGLGLNETFAGLSSADLLHDGLIDFAERIAKRSAFMLPLATTVAGHVARLSDSKGIAVRLDRFFKDVDDKFRGQEQRRGRLREDLECETYYCAARQVSPDSTFGHRLHAKTQAALSRLSDDGDVYLDFFAGAAAVADQTSSGSSILHTHFVETAANLTKDFLHPRADPAITRNNMLLAMLLSVEVSLRLPEQSSMLNTGLAHVSDISRLFYNADPDSALSLLYHYASHSDGFLTCNSRLRPLMADLFEKFHGAPHHALASEPARKPRRQAHDFMRISVTFPSLAPRG